ncbi:MAG: hypothetical protein ABIS08_11670 [Pseudolysinimonas sp.]
MSRAVKVAELADRAETSTDATVLRDLSRHTSKTVRVLVARNPAADDETIGRMSQDAEEVVRLACAGNLAGRPSLQRAAAESPEKWVRAALASTFARDDEGSLPYDLQARLARDEFREARGWVAETTNYEDLFAILIADPDPRVRARCAANPRISRAQMEVLVTDRQWGVRAYTASAGLRYPDDEQAMRLARDRSAEVRWAVLFRVDRPRAAIELIAQDTDEMNRRHAQSELDFGSNTLPDAEASVRANRERARRGLEFESPPG